MGHRFENYAHLEGRLHGDPVSIQRSDGGEGTAFKIEISEEVRGKVGTHTLREIFDVETEYAGGRLLATLKAGASVSIDAEVRIRHSDDANRPYYFLAHRVHSFTVKTGASHWARDGSIVVRKRDGDQDAA